MQGCLFLIGKCLQLANMIDMLPGSLVNGKKRQTKNNEFLRRIQVTDIKIYRYFRRHLVFQNRRTEKFVNCTARGYTCTCTFNLLTYRNWFLQCIVCTKMPCTVKDRHGMMVVSTGVGVTMQAEDCMCVTTGTVWYLLIFLIQ